MFDYLGICQKMLAEWQTVQGSLIWANTVLTFYTGNSVQILRVTIFCILLQHTVLNLITTHIPLSSQSSNFLLSSDYSP